MAHVARRVVGGAATILTTALLNGCASPESDDSPVGGAGQGGAPPTAGARADAGPAGAGGAGFGGAVDTGPAGAGGDGGAGFGGAVDAGAAGVRPTPVGAPISIDGYGCPCTGGGSDPIRVSRDCVCDGWGCTRLCDEDVVNDTWVGTPWLYADCDLVVLDFTFGYESGDTRYLVVYRGSTGEQVYRSVTANWNTQVLAYNYFTCGDLQARTYEVGSPPDLGECGQSVASTFEDLCGHTGAGGAAGVGGVAGANSSAGVAGAGGAAGVAGVAEG